MKKLLMLLTAMLFVSCAMFKTGPNKVIGQWEGTDRFAGATLVVNADNTWTANVNGNEMDGTWTCESGEFMFVESQIIGTINESGELELAKEGGEPVIMKRMAVK